jgi:hypothetical protein
MLRLLSLIIIVPDMALPFWVTLQVIFSWPLVSDDVPLHVPDRLVAGAVGLVTTAAGVDVGAAGEDVLPPHALTVSRLRTTRVDARISNTPLGLCEVVETGCPGSQYNRFTKPTSGDAWMETPLECNEHGP